MPYSGHSVIKAPGEEAWYYVYHSEVVDNTGRHQWQPVFNEAAHTALLARVSIANRPGSARHKGTTVNLTVIARYAPTFDAAEETHAGGILGVVGDRNARPGPVDTAT